MAKSLTPPNSTGPNMDPGKADPTGHHLDHISHINGVGHDHDSIGYLNGVGHAKFHDPEDDDDHDDDDFDGGDFDGGDFDGDENSDNIIGDDADGDAPYTDDIDDLVSALFSLPALSEDPLDDQVEEEDMPVDLD